jgi:putative selenate reductase
MGDKFSPIPVERLFKWVMPEEDSGGILGIPPELFFQPRPDDLFRMTRYGQLLETPIGVAAGPHTQLAQNIIAAWLTGARYIELKTAQTLDQIEVAKPCIDMEDEGYNCEWSQELTLDETFTEYLNAWILLYLLRDKLDWGWPQEAGFIFNMSIGYDLAGILKPNVQRYLDRMTDCRADKEVALERLLPLYPRLSRLDIPDQISDNITLSTMHGCPPDEIEKIGRYLIEERQLHTAIKLNPTLLGPERLRNILNERLGYEVEVPDSAFEHDLKLDQAFSLIESLRACAAETGVQFGLKLTNTLEVRNTNSQLPADESMLYLSGRALHPLSIQVAAMLQDHFEGQLDISFCAGVDCFNAADTLACNLGPLTSCSDLLKPGGVTRLGQYLNEIEQAIKESGAGDLESYILSRDGGNEDIAQAGWRNLQDYASKVLEEGAYSKERVQYSNIKTPRQLASFDCIQAPCITSCAVEQDVPTYLYHASRGELDQAYEAVLDANPLPHTTGMVCNHLCEPKCTRINYDNPLLIREIKRFIAEHHPGKASFNIPQSTGHKAAIVGAGPSGLSCAYFLARAGVEVELFESGDTAGGMVAHAIPTFRLSETGVQKDVDLILAMGVQLHANTTIDRAAFDDLRRTHDTIYVSVGAQQAKKLGIPGEDGVGVIDQLSFLRTVRDGGQVNLGQKVVVIGGGDSAIDAARTARRLAGQNGQVSVIYRRTRNEMPAARDEIHAMLAEDIQIQELTAPESIILDNGTVHTLVCARMQLGETDDSGRPRPLKIEGSEFTLPLDTIIPAIGQEVVLDFLPETSLDVNPATFETQYPGIFAGGDTVRGADTLINAIGDGKRAAEEILQRISGEEAGRGPHVRQEASIVHLQQKQAHREYGPPAPEIALDSRGGFELVHPGLDEESVKLEASRCLLCDEFCNICVLVCPNLANVSYTVEPQEFTIPRAKPKGKEVQIEMIDCVHVEQRHQILNIGDLCNECGNCTTFCPTSGSPFRDKPKFFLTERSYAQEESGYFLKDEILRSKRDGSEATLSRVNAGLLYETELVQTRIDLNNFTLRDLRFKTEITEWIDFRQAAEMVVIWKSLKELPLFQH